MRGLYSRLIGLSLILLLCSCTSAHHGLYKLSAYDQARDAVPAFSLRILDSTFIYGGTLESASLNLVESPGLVFGLHIFVSNAASLKAFHFQLDYNPEEWMPAALDWSGQFKAAGETLELSDLISPGSISSCCVLANYESHEGVNGSFCIAKIFFTRRTDIVGRVPSKAPTRAMSQIQLRQGFKSVTWDYNNRGDNNQNGEVEVGDIVPIAQYYRQTWGEDERFIDSVEHLVDGDGNGEINTADLIIVSLNVGVSVLGGYNIYSSSNLGDYPSSPLEENGPSTTLLGHIDLPASTDPRIRLQPEFVLPPEVTDHYFWVRAVDSSGAEGLASTSLTFTGYKAPDEDFNSPQLNFDFSNGILRWYYTNNGDFDHNTVVNNDDLELLQTFYGTQGPFSQPDYRYELDLDKDGKIDQADYFPFALYVGNEVAGYAVYLSADLTDYPESNTQVSKLEPLHINIQQVAYSQSPPVYSGASRILYQAKLPPTPPMYAWLRPYDSSGFEGTPSNWVPVNVSFE